MPTLTITLPIRPGKLEAWRRFRQELQASRRLDYEASRRRLGISNERFTLVQTPVGAAVRISIEATDVGQALADLAASTHSFDRWYKDKLRELHGFHFSGTHMGENEELSQINAKSPGRRDIESQT